MEFQDQNIVLCLLTVLLSQASIFSVGKDISQAIGYMILAHLVNLFHLTIWDPESVRSLSKDSKMSWAYLPLYVIMGFSWVRAVFTESAVVSLGMYLLAIRSNLALCDHEVVSSLLGQSFDEHLVLLTGLRLCQEIQREESERSGAAANGDYWSRDSLKEPDDYRTQEEGWELVNETEFHTRDEHWKTNFF